ncbi:MAG: hypothetical protein WC762_03015 [Methylobacter sp.]|jgi:hypothetical protein
MKKTIIILALAASSTAAADVYVNGYNRQDGTYVQPHHRSDPDGSTYNNYSSPGNKNPYTGSTGGQSYQHPQSGNNQSFGGNSQPLGGYDQPLGGYYR